MRYFATHLPLLQVWLAPGSGYANDFLDQLQRLSTDSTAAMLAIFGFFALLHSGLAYLRPQGTLCTKLPAASARKEDRCYSLCPV